MSRQVIGEFQQLLAPTAAANGAPSGDQAGRLVMSTAFSGAVPKSIDWILRVRITAIHGSPPVAQDFEADVYLWGRDEEDQIWGYLGEDNGQLNGGDTFTGNGAGNWYFIYTNLGLFQDLWLQVANIVGDGFSIQADLAPFYNCEANGLVGGG